MSRTSAIYFDGVSSAPQKVELVLDEANREFVFESSSNPINKWKVEDTTFEYSGANLYFYFGKTPVQIIKIDEPDFIVHTKKFLKETGQIGWYQKLVAMGFKLHIAIALGIIGFIVLAYLIIIPWVAEKAIIVIPQSYDIEIGNTFFQEYVKYNSVDSAKSKSLNLFAKQLNLNNNQKLDFVVIKSNTVNAFALPDGHIVVFTGLIELMKDYEELAGLIGHEVSHVNNRHSMKMMCRNLSGYLFISVVLSDVNGIMAIIGDNLHNLKSLSYSRQFERQADREGLDLMIENMINPQGMTNLFERLQLQHEALLPEFLSSHPLTTERISYIRNQIKHKQHQIKDEPLLKELFQEIKK